ncbi:MAG: dephospho-CoA kinase [Candidatus Nanopelagicales bacterium]
MIVILTGGIGCGKSSVALMLTEFGARCVDADEIVHGLYERAEVQDLVGRAVGLQAPLTRADVARRVFGDDAVLRRLEAVLHPMVWERMTELRRATAPDEVLVFEIPLPPTPEYGDVVICVEADEGVRVSRLRERGMQDADIYARIAAAPGPLAYREHAQHVISNNGDLESLRRQVQRLWKDVQDGARTV